MDEQVPSLRWPSQDQIDRSDHFAIAAFLRNGPGQIDWQAIWDANDEFKQAFNDAVQEAINEVVPNQELTATEAEHYQVGPAAQGLPTYIVTILEHAQQLWPLVEGPLQDLVVAEIIRKTVTKTITKLKSVTSKPIRPVIILTPYDLEQLCRADVRQRYNHPRAKLTSEWTPITTEFYAGYVSPSHPTSSMEYLVTVKVGKKSYAYAVNGSGEAQSHTLREGKQVIELPIPKLLGEDPQD